MVSNPALRISRLRRLIDHPRTGTEECAAAQRALDRILEKSRSPVANAGRSYGPRHARVGRHVDLHSIAEMIREDIRLARTVFSTTAAADDLALPDPIGNAPADINFDVETPFDSEIVITLSSVPAEWGWHHEPGLATVSPALQALADDLRAIIDGYNHDGSDTAKRYFGKVRADGHTLSW